MPQYTFLCKSCQETFEIVQSMSKYTGKAPCPKCKKQSKTRDYLKDKTFGFMAQPTTVGGLADRHADKMSTDQKESLQAKHTEYLKDRKTQTMEP